MVYVVDIDGTICTLPRKLNGETDYSTCKPLSKQISKFNKLHKDGHTIIYFTARGMGRTNNNRTKAYDLFYDLTKNQLSQWDVKFHDLLLGKPAADLYIDDKAINIKDFK
jgi:hypothetical protein